MVIGWAALVLVCLFAVLIWFGRILERQELLMGKIVFFEPPSRRMVKYLDSLEKF
jgi:hypothetical protein